MRGAEEQRHLDVHYRVVGQYARRQSFQDALLYGGDIFTRNGAAFDGIDEFKTFAGRLWFYLQHHVAILAATTGLLDKFAFARFAGIADGFAEGHLRLADGGVDAEFAPHTLDQNLQVQLAHAGDD